MKCTESSTSNGKEFWKVIKPIATFKNKESSSNIMLLENNNVISNPHDVSNILNKHYVFLFRQVLIPLRMDKCLLNLTSLCCGIAYLLILGKREILKY